MAKGFIDIEWQGGGYQKDKTVYALVDDWKWWVKDSIIKQKPPGKGAGTFALKKNSTTELVP